MSRESEIRDRSDELHDIYTFRYSNLPRLTRNLALLRDISSEAEKLIRDARGKSQELTRLLTQRARLYKQEMGEIEKAQRHGPHAISAANVGGDANAIFHHYRRRFAGKARLSRDLHLLDEMIEDLRGIADAFEVIADSWPTDEIKNDIQAVSNNLQLYRTERDEIARLRDEMAPEEAVAATAEWANELFGVYRRQFAGLSRLSRRPALLARMIASLKEAGETMERYRDSGVASETLEGNINLVRGQIGTWESEHAALIDARSQSDVYAVLSALAQERDAVWAAYNTEFAGQSRDTRDLETLGGLLDRANEVARQARELHRVYDIDESAQLLETARDQRLILMREYDEIKKAQTPNA